MGFFSGLFSLSKEIAIDLGTANTIIIHNDKIVIDEPSIIARDTKTGKEIAVGREAQKMRGKENAGIETIRPLRKGVIADFNAAEMMIRGLVKKASAKSKWFSQPHMKMVVGIPSGSTEVEIRAVRDSSANAGGRDVYMIYEPMAAALGIGIDVVAPEGNMIVDIGGGTTEIAVISLGGIVSNKSIQTAGDDLTDDIQDHMSRVHNIKVGERTAELIKINVGSALTELENPPADFIVRGPNKMTALPMEVPVSYQEISHAIEKSIQKIETAVLSALENTPPELYADIVKNGIYLAGGGALLRGLDKRLTDKIGIQFHTAENPLLAVAMGTGVALKNIEKFTSFLIK
ncbi:MAG: rod shape-determining protein [Muribaculaceae bacterium]|nr:rod shape-determining protein [Muribaculaceae bacterium]